MLLGFLTSGRTKSNFSSHLSNKWLTNMKVIEDKASSDEPSDHRQIAVIWNWNEKGRT